MFRGGEIPDGGDSSMVRRGYTVAVRKLGAWMFFAGFAVGLGGTAYAMARAFNAAQATGGAAAPDLTPYVDWALRLTFAGLAVAALGAVLFLLGVVVMFVRPRRAQ